MTFVFALPGFGDSNYRRCLDAAGAASVLMSFYYLRQRERIQVEAYVNGGHWAERSLAEKVV